MTMKIRLSVLLLAALLAWPLPAMASDGNWDATFYGIQLTVDPSVETIAGRTVIRASAAVGGVSTIDLDLVDLGVTMVDETGAGLRPFVHKGGVLSVTLSRPFLVGEPVELSVYYEGAPTAGVHFHPNQNLVFTYGWDDESRNWFPCLDHPSDKADSADIEITVPAGMVVAANGMLQRHERRGDRDTFLWRHEYPITTYNICFHASDYAQFTQYHGALPIEYYVYPEDLADAQASFQNIPQMMAHFEAVFGPYPYAGEKMGFAEAQLGGGMEHQTMVTIGSAFINGGTHWETLYAHEAAHMWWGDCVSIATWADFWLSEGFASYGDALWQEGGYGVEALQNRMRTFRNQYFAEDANNRFPIYDPEVLLSSTVYEKGAWIVHMLRRVFNDDEAFFAMLQDYRAAHEHGNVTTAQFQAAAEAACGFDLDWFFDTWVYMAGYPELEYSWSYSPGMLEIRIDQVQEVDGLTPLFEMPVDLLFDSPMGQFRVTPWVREKSTVVEWPISIKPDRMIFDPDLWLLCTAEDVGGTAGVLAAPGPFPGNACVVGAFDEAGTLLADTFSPYGVDRWGARVAAGDLDGNGVDEIITGPGPGPVFGPQVRAFHLSGDQVPGVNFFAYGTPRWGVNVSAGDVDGDWIDEIITGAGPGAVFGPHVRGFDVDGSGAVTPIPGISFFAYGTLRYGVNVTCGDLDGDAFDEIVTGAGPGAVFGAHVRGWNVDGGAASAMPGVSFFAYGTPKWGVDVACGDIDGDGADEIITGAGPGQGFASHVRAFRYVGGTIIPIPGVNFFAYGADGPRYGATVSAADLDDDGTAELIVGPGPDPAVTGLVRTFRYHQGAIEGFSDFEAYPGVSGGTDVAGGRFEAGN